MAMDVNFYSFYSLQIDFNARITIFDSTHMHHSFRELATDQRMKPIYLRGIFGRSLYEALHGPSNAKSPLFGNAPRNRRKREMDPMRARVRRSERSLAVFKASSSQSGQIAPSSLPSSLPAYLTYHLHFVFTPEPNESGSCRRFSRAREGE